MQSFTIFHRLEESSVETVHEISLPIYFRAMKILINILESDHMYHQIHLMARIQEVKSHLIPTTQDNWITHFKKTLAVNLTTKLTAKRCILALKFNVMRRKFVEILGSRLLTIHHGTTASPII